MCVCKLNMDNTNDSGNWIHESQMLLNEDENDVGFVTQNSFKESLVESDSSFDFNDNNMRIEDFSDNELVLSCSKIEEKLLTDMGIDEFKIQIYFNLLNFSVKMQIVQIHCNKVIS